MFGFRARSYSELKLSGDMLGVNERAEGNRGGCKSAKAVKGDEGAGKKEEEEEDEKDKEWKAADEAKRVPYTKNKWVLVAEYHDIDMEEALSKAAEIMIEDFDFGFWPVSGRTWPRDPFQRVGLEKWCRTNPKILCRRIPHDDCSTRLVNVAELCRHFLENGVMWLAWLSSAQLSLALLSLA